MLCVSLREPDLASLHAAVARAAEAGADMAEVRCDDLPPDADPRPLIAASPLPLIVTCRPEREGGGWRHDEARRREFLRAASAAGARWVDVEADTYTDLAGRLPGAVIVSRHFPMGTSSDAVEQEASRLGRLGAAAVKVAWPTEDPTDVLRAGRIVAGLSIPALALPGGPVGLPARVLYRVFGSPWTYVRLDETSEGTAPGQPSLSEMRDVYRARELDSATAIYGVIGHPIAHSLSPRLFQEAFAHAGRNAVFLPWDVPHPNDLPRLLAEPTLAGASVTIPHKKALAACIPSRDPAVLRTGAANTFVRPADGAPWCANTDAAAVMELLEGARASGVDASGAMILGAGGAARSAAYAISAAGIPWHVAGRTPARAQRLAADLGGTAVPWEQRHAAAIAADVVIQTTPLGQWPREAECALAPEDFREGQWVLDAVYRPARTTFLRHAQAAGARTAPGAAWFLAQARRQARIWFGENFALPDEAPALDADEG